MSLDANDTGNFVVRLGYVTAALHSGDMRIYLLQQGATEEEINDAYLALVKLANGTFYRGKM